MFQPFLAPRSMIGVEEVECSPSKFGLCCCEQAGPKYVVRKETWQHPQKGNKQQGKGPRQTVVLLGGTGVGKSNLGNFLVGEQAFVSRQSQESVTLQPSVVDGGWFGGRQPVRVVDCAGINDTKGETADHKQFQSALKVLRDVGEVNTLVMVMKAGRFTKFEREIILRLRERFGPIFWRNLCIFYTGATAKPSQLDLVREGSELKLRLVQVEMELSGNIDSMQEVNFQAQEDIAGLRLYAADLDPTLCCPESRAKEFRLKRALKDLELDELLQLDRKIPPNVLEMPDRALEKFMTTPPAEAWIQGNYFQLGLSRLLNLRQDVQTMKPFSVEGMRDWAPIAEEELQDEAPQVGTPIPEHFKRALMEKEMEMGNIDSQGVLVLPAEDGDDEPSSTMVGDSGGTPETGVNEGVVPPRRAAHPTLQSRGKLDSIRRALLEADEVMVHGSWVDRMHQNGAPLPRREDLLETAMGDAQISWNKGGRTFYLL